jgi:hypothetical protein
VSVRDDRPSPAAGRGCQLDVPHPATIRSSRVR